MVVPNALEAMGFTDNPFAIVPPYVKFAEIWADREELKEDIMGQLLFSLKTSPSKFIINWGDIGTGKTYAAKYFSNTKVLESICKQKGISPPPLSLVIRLPEPTKPRQALIDLYISFLNELGFDRLREKIIEICSQLRPPKEDIFGKKIEEDLLKSGLNENLAKIFWRLSVSSSSGLIEKRYLYREATSHDLEEMEMVRGIESVGDILDAVSGIINFLVTNYGHGPACSEIFIWFDESERIDSYSGADLMMLRGFLRDIIDYAPNDLTVFFNYDLEPGDKFEDIAGNIGYAVWDRIERPINFGPMGEETAFNYVIELMNNDKIRPKKLQRKCPDKFYPFTSNALKMIIRNIKTTSIITPRNLSKKCTEILQCFVPKKEGDRIDEDFLNENKKRFFPEKGKES